MLQLKNRIRKFHLPTLHHRALQLSVVINEDDELIQAIDNAVIEHDDNWTLEPTPDTVELEQKWSAIQADISNDPQWHRFEDE